MALVVAAHRDDLLRREEGITVHADQRCEIRKRAQGNDGAATCMEFLSHELDRGFRRRKRRRYFREKALAEAVRTVGIECADILPLQRPVRTEENRHILTTEEMKNLPRVPIPHLERRITRDDRDAAHIQLWTRQRQHDREGIINPRITIENYFSLHRSPLSFKIHNKK